MGKKRALITGISGQDGAYLTQFLLKKGYEVVGGERQNASGSLWRLRELGIDKDIEVVTFELLEENNINEVIKNGNFTEIYNLAAQSFVGSSYVTPLFTTNVNALGVTRILEAIRNYSNKTRFYQASTSEMYGNSIFKKQNENTNFQPTSPYAISKLYAHWMVNLYRDAYNIFCCSGILFNHESPLRGKEFVTRKITDGVAKIKLGLAKKLTLGNLDAKRDWGFAGDFVEAMYTMVQQDEPGDYVICTGIQHSIRELLTHAFETAEIDNWEKYIETDPRFKRPAELHALHGSYAKAKTKLGWEPKTSFKDMIALMVQEDIKRLSNDLR